MGVVFHCRLRDLGGTGLPVFRRVLLSGPIEVPRSLVFGSASRRSNQGRELNQVRPGNSVRGMGNECCHGKTVGWHWRVLGDAGFGYVELLESLWVVPAKNTSINTGLPVAPRVWLASLSELSRRKRRSRRNSRGHSITWGGLHSLTLESVAPGYVVKLRCAKIESKAQHKNLRFVLV
jgi:hypothetical protein